MRARAPPIRAPTDGGAWYGIAHRTAAEETTFVRNVNAFSDLAVRDFFLDRGQLVDALFVSDQPLPASVTPTESDIADRDAAIRRGIAESLMAYGLNEADLIGGDYSVDGQGISRFLALHPVVLQGDRFTVQATSPDDGTRTTLVGDLAFAENLLADDVMPPAAPVILRVLPAASNEIVLAWDPATDDRVIARYEIVRDGQVIATTPYPLFRDLPVASGVAYTYQVTALDAAGNRSGAATAEPVVPLSSPDTLAPAAPTALDAVVGPAFVDVRWQAPDASDIARYRVLRSVAGGMLETLANVTSRRTLDSGLIGGREHCYRIVAIDASLNESPVSDEVCATPPSRPGVSEPVGTDAASIDTDALRAVDVSTEGTASEENRLEYVVIENAGTAQGSTAALTLRSSDSAATRISIPGRNGRSADPVYRRGHGGRPSGWPAVRLQPVARQSAGTRRNRVWRAK